MMSFAMQNFVPHEMKMSVIKVFTYGDNDISGVVVNPYYKKEMYFKNFAQLIFIIEDLMDSLNFPQKSMESRVFSIETDNVRHRKIIEGEAPPGSVVTASFQLSVYFRQNASWQGNLVWMDKKMESSFRSVLELITLIDNVMEDVQNAKPEGKTRL